MIGQFELIIVPQSTQSTSPTCFIEFCAFVWEYSGIYSGYSAFAIRIAGMEIQVFQNRKSSQRNTNLYYSNYSHSGLIPNERALQYYVHSDWPKRVKTYILLYPLIPTSARFLIRQHYARLRIRTNLIK